MVAYHVDDASRQKERRVRRQVDLRVAGMQEVPGLLLLFHQLIHLHLTAAQVFFLARTAHHAARDDAPLEETGEDKGKRLVLGGVFVTCMQCKKVDYMYRGRNG